MQRGRDCPPGFPQGACCRVAFRHGVDEPQVTRTACERLRASGSRKGPVPQKKAEGLRESAAGRSGRGRGLQRSGKDLRGHARHVLPVGAEREGRHDVPASETRARVRNGTCPDR